MKILWAALATVCLILIGGAIVAWSGAYNVAALAPTASVERSLLHGIMQQSVRAHAAADHIEAPQDLASRAPKGARDFEEMCSTCHGAPGKGPSEIGVGLNPRPPRLEEASLAWSAPEMFWIVKNGVRMTGMPAFGPTHDDQRIWSIVAFARTLPGMSSDAYAHATGGAADAGSMHDHSAHGHSHDHGDDHGHASEHDQGHQESK
ncbi:cytochrome c [Bradyrhizobium sp. 139]|uniref:c-type cytochrome n=1 Tax=Bradyrhizobium sp. 139 TaxID=2782616 RepID=UPI001FF83501|nr:cytochrome c [Bradyrhizobium sp. 139]MCK1739410.1 cytochrome c [Bradyrhizobium sp. 139]